MRLPEGVTCHQERTRPGLPHSALVPPTPRPPPDVLPKPGGRGCFSTGRVEKKKKVIKNQVANARLQVLCAAKHLARINLLSRSTTSEPRTIANPCVTNGKTEARLSGSPLPSALQASSSPGTDMPRPRARPRAPVTYQEARGLRVAEQMSMEAVWFVLSRSRPRAPGATSENQ